VCACIAGECILETGRKFFLEMRLLHLLRRLLANRPVIPVRVFCKMLGRGGGRKEKFRPLFHAPVQPQTSCAPAAAAAA
jgi:hypothetical protein